MEDWSPESQSTGGPADCRANLACQSCHEGVWHVAKGSASECVDPKIAFGSPVQSSSLSAPVAICAARPSPSPSLALVIDIKASSQHGPIRFAQYRVAAAVESESDSDQQSLAASVRQPGPTPRAPV